MNVKLILFKEQKYKKMEKKESKKHNNLTQYIKIKTKGSSIFKIYV